jgi:hypothetical protein
MLGSRKSGLSSALAPSASRYGIASDAVCAILFVPRPRARAVLLTVFVVVAESGFGAADTTPAPLIASHSKQVFSGVGMTFRAVSLARVGCLNGHAAKDVGSVRDGLKMVGSKTAARSAEMVDFETRRHRAVRQLPCDDVCVVSLAVVSGPSVSNFHRSAGPQPATSARSVLFKQSGDVVSWSFHTWNVGADNTVGKGV